MDISDPVRDHLETAMAEDGSPHIYGTRYIVVWVDDMVETLDSPEDFAAAVERFREDQDDGVSMFYPVEQTTGRVVWLNKQSVSAIEMERVQLVKAPKKKRATVKKKAPSDHTN